jgi:molybdate transport system substrate-binding protein
MKVDSMYSNSFQTLRRSILKFVLGAAVPLLFAACATQPASPPPGTEIRVITSGAFTEAYKQLVPAFEKQSGYKIVSAYGASMGKAPDSIPSRLDRGEAVDVLIMAGPALDNLIAQGKVMPGSRVDLVRSSVGFAVRTGAPKPDISTVDKLKQTLLNAKSIAYSASASGTYFSTELVQKLGIADQVLPKSKQILSERVGTVVARGDAELGLQQVSELVPIKGIDYIGPLPEPVQQVTYFSAGIAINAKEPAAARVLIKYFTSAQAAPIIEKTGLEPVLSK